MTASPAAAPPKPTATTETTEGCDNCGRGIDHRPIRLADFRIDLPSGGQLYFCASHEAANAAAILATGGTITRIR